MPQYASWTARLNGETDAELDVVSKDFAGMKEGQSLLRPTALMVEEIIRQIPQGQEMSVSALRQQLAKENRVDVSCPISVGFHLRTIAEAANEALEAGAEVSDITPFWRVMNSKTAATPRLSFGTSLLKKMRQKEGLVF